MLNKITAIVGILAFSGITYSQESETVNITWEDPMEVMDGEQSVLVPSMRGQYVTGKRPLFFYSHRVNNVNSRVDIEVLGTQNATPDDLLFLEKYDIKVGRLDYEGKISSAKRAYFLMLNIFPFVMEGSKIVRISSFRVNYSKEKPNFNHVSKDFVTSSVLKSGTGNWYKLSVNQDGIYKIDRALLISMGINVDNLNPQDINVFGNGDGLLPEGNSTPRTDDLAKNAIKIVGEADGSFDANDYILFYGWGPNRWYPNNDTTRFKQTKHIYSDFSCYYININSGDTPLRIEDVFETPAPPTHNVNEQTYYSIHELDNVSLVGGGQRWYGELFDADLTQTFTFNVPNIISTSPANFEASLASSANISSGTEQEYSVGGVVMLSSVLPTSSDYGRSTNMMSLSNPSASLPVQVRIVRNSPDILTYLDRIELNARRKLTFIGSQLNFSDLESVGPSNVSEFTLNNMSPSTGFVWEVSNRHQPFNVAGTFNSTDFVFRLETDSVRQFVASNGASYFTPLFIGEVVPQDLHALSQADYLIVTHPEFISQAERLAQLHIQNGLTVHVVTTNQIYNEFSSGVQDATAIRSFAKMFYDRAVALPGTEPKYLLLFGDGTYDPKNRVANNNNYILTYQMNNSDFTEDHIGNMPSDDYFGMLDDNEVMAASDLVDIGIGRLLISNLQMAKEAVDKI